jgi:hypothetical protein
VSVREYYPYKQNVARQEIWLTRMRMRFLMILLHADITMGTPSMGPFGSFKYVNWSVNDDGTPYQVIYIYICNSLDSITYILITYKAYFSLLLTIYSTPQRHFMKMKISVGVHRPALSIVKTRVEKNCVGMIPTRARQIVRL